MASTATARKPDAAPAVIGLAPYLCVDGATRAAAFYARAFGAEEVARHPVDEKGRTMHVHLYVNGSSLMLTDAYPEHGHPAQKPQGWPSPPFRCRLAGPKGVSRPGIIPTDAPLA